MPNIYSPDWDAHIDRPPFVSRRARLGRQAGSQQLGASLYELPPGASTFPLHIHHANEELIIVLSGSPMLRDLESQRELAPGDVVACPAGRGGAHRIDNRTDEPVRLLILSTMLYPEVNEYPDSGKLWARNYPAGGEPPADPLDVLVHTDSPVEDYFEGETDPPSEP